MSVNAPGPLGWRQVFAAQLKVCFLRRRRGQAIFLAFVLAQVVALAGFGVILGLNISIDGEETTVAMAPLENLEKAMNVSAEQAVSGLAIAFHIMAVFAFFFPFAIWSNEQPSKRGYHWAMPVDRRTHDLARVAAGVVMLLGMLTIVYGVSMLVSLVSGNSAGLGSLSLTFWLALFVGPLLPYALNSVLLVRCEHPAGWLWGGLGALALISTFSTVLHVKGVTRLIEIVFAGSWGLLQGIVGPIWSEWAGRPTTGGAEWLGVWVLWMALFVVGIVVAASARTRSR